MKKKREGGTGKPRRGIWLAGVVLITGLIITGWAALWTKSSLEEITKRDFAFTCNEINLKIGERLKDQQQILRSGAAFFEASDSITREKWRDFVAGLRLDQNYPGILGTGFAAQIPPQQLARHIREIRRQGFPDYKVWPEGRREAYSAIIYLEPFSGRNLRAFGYDMYSEPVRRAAMAMARDNDSPALSGKVLLVQETGQDVQAGILMYVPVYRQGMPRATVAQRRAALRGWVYSPYRMNDLMRGILGGWDVLDQNRIRLQVFDGDRPDPETLLYDSQAGGGAEQPLVSKFQVQMPVEFGGRRWTLGFDRQGGLTPAVGYARAWIILITGTIISLLLAVIIMFLQNARFIARQMAERLTGQMEQKNKELTDAVESLQAGEEELRAADEELRQQNRELEESEQARRELANRLNLLIDGVTDHAIIMLDADGKILRWNAGAERINGYRAEEIVGQPFSRFFAPEDVLAGKPQRLLEAALEQGRAEDEGWRVRRDGSLFWANAVISPLRSPEGALLGFAKITRDLTERKRAEEKLQESEQRFRLAAAGSSAGIWDWDVLTNKEYWSPAFYNLLGYQDQEVEATLERFADLLHPEDKKAVFDMVDAHFAKRLPYYIELRLQTKTGVYKWFLASGQAQWDENSKPIRMVGTIIDITERKRAEEKITESEERYRRITEGLSDYLYTVTVRDGRAVETTHSPACQAITGYAPEEYQADPDLWINMAPAEDRDLIAERAKDVLAGIKVSPLEHRIIRKDGKVRWVSDTIIQKFDDQRRLVSYDGVVHDVTQRKLLELKLQENERKYRTLVETSPDGITLTDLEGNIVLCNRQTAYMHRYENPDMMRGIKAFDLIAPDDRPLAEQYAQQTLVKGLITNIEYTMLRSDGQLFPAELSAALIRDAEGIPSSFIAVTRDITERKQAEEEIKYQRDTLGAIYENSPYIIALVDREGKVGSINKAGVEFAGGGARDALLGRLRGEVLNCLNSFDGLGCGRNAACNDCLIRSNVNSTLRTKEPIKNAEGKMTFLMGGSENERDLLVSTNLIKQGDSDSVLLTVADITERKQAEAKLKDQARLLDEASDAIILRDLKNNILYWNKSAERIYGWSAEEVIGRNARDSFFKFELEQFEAVVKEAMHKGYHEGEYQHVTKAGKPLTVNKRLTLIRDDSGKPRAVLSIDTDITEKKSLQARYLQAQRLESLGTLAGGIAHDLNNVLAPIMLAVEALKKYVTDPGGLGMVEILEKSSARCSQILKQILGFARGTGDKLAAFQPRQVIKETVSLVQETLPRSIRVKKDIPNDLWSIRGNATQVHQVLMNLCVNARDAMPRGGNLTVTAENVVLDEEYARQHPEASPGRYLLLTVQDTGTGMSPETRARIFDPFFTTKAPGKGTGLGLCTIHSIVKNHGGFINVYSEEGKGTAFKVYFPAAEAAPDGAEKPAEKKLAQGNGQLVLVVDDEQAILQITSQTLEAFGYRTLTASDGAEAVVLYEARGHEISLVLTDSMMPNMDGLTTIRELRKRNPRAKVIISSGLSAADPAIFNEYAEANAFIAKPYTAATLLQTIQQALEI